MRAAKAICAGMMLATGGLAAPATKGRLAGPEMPWQAARACALIKGMVIPASAIGLPTRGALIDAAEEIAGSGPTPVVADLVPDHCRIDGHIRPVDPAAPNITFRVVIPHGWTGKAIQIGGNGADGFVPLLVKLPRDFQGSPSGATLPPHTPNLIAQGYATYGGDSGHQGGVAPGPPGSGARPDGATPPSPDWVRNEEAYSNLGYLQIKKTHDAAMAVFRALYGKPSRITFFGGESQGGRAAMQAAARYPADYDGILSSVPLLYFSGVVAARPLRAQMYAEPGAWLSPAKRALIAGQTQKLCDELDGLKDGVISNYLACDVAVDPKAHPGAYAPLRCPDGKPGEQCLSDTELRTLDRVHSPVEFTVRMLNGETSSPGFAAGNEDRPGWAEMPDTQPVPGRRAYTADYHLTIRYADRPSKGDLFGNSPSAMRTELQDLSAHLDAPENLSRFFAKGGKLLFYSAANDFLSNNRGQYHFFEQMKKRVGATTVERHVRYYVQPFANHPSLSMPYRSSEQLPRYADLMGALTSWVEGGVVPPDTLPQTLEDNQPPYAVRRARPLCRYPLHPQYLTGDVTLATSYACRK